MEAEDKQNVAAVVTKEELEIEGDGLHNIYEQLCTDDTKRASMRAAIQGAVDGNAPWKPEVLKKYGREDQSNVNFLELASVIADWCDAYTELALDVPRIMALTPQVSLGSEDMMRFAPAIEQVFHDTITGWKGWLQHHLAQINQLVTHGHGHFYFPFPKSWRFQALRVDQAKIPEDYSGELDELPLCAVGPFPMSLIDLYKMVASDDACDYSRSIGWDCDMIRKAIVACANRGVEEKDHYTMEDCQAKLQRGNIGVSGDPRLTKGCQVAHIFAQGMDGEITKFIIIEGRVIVEPLFRKEQAVEMIPEAVAFFFLKGSTTSFHAVRGVGKDGYSTAVIVNRLQNKIVDEGEEAMTPTYKAGPGGSDGREAVRHKGRFKLIPSNWESMAEKNQGTFMAGQAAVRSIRNTLAMTTKSPSVMQAVMRDSTQPRTAAEIESANNMGQDVRVTLAKLYYLYRDALMQNLYRRMFGDKIPDEEPGSSEQAEAWGKLMSQGITAEIWDPKRWNIAAARSIGQGSRQSGKKALEAIGPLYPRLDTHGQREWDRQYISLHVGHSQAKAFITEQNRDELPSADRSYAQLETSLLVKTGAGIEASPDQPPRIHLMVHFEAATQIAQQFQQSGDPSGYPGFEALLVHSAPHVDHMLQDQSMLQEAEQWKERLAGLVDVLKEMGRQFQAMQDAQQKQQQQQIEQQIQVEAARQSGAAEADLAGQMEKISSDERVKMRKAEGALALKAEKQGKDFVLAMKRLDDAFVVAREKNRKDADAKKPQ